MCGSDGTIHCLPIKQRITFKLASITFKTLHTCQLGYLRELLHFHTPARNLRSSSQGLLSVSRTRTVLASHRFRHSAVSVVQLFACIHSQCFND